VWPQPVHPDQRPLRRPVWMWPAVLRDARRPRRRVMAARSPYRVAPALRGGWNALHDTTSGPVLLNVTTHPYARREDAEARLCVVMAAHRLPTSTTPR
jgi:hypothetical protein